MKKIILSGDDSFDLDILLTTRLLIQANSGHGKSYLIRKLAEQLFGKVQIIIIDPEGDFGSLRERFDFVLVGNEGDTPADPRSAGLLAEKLLELNASAVCDIFELKASQRHEWVKLFLDALINAPKKLWHPVVIIVDEAHTFAPEKGMGESVALDSMIELASKGRKRGFCGIFATQRLGKLSKNVAAELLNVFIGGTFIDVDRQRASETLGILKSDKEDFFRKLKVLAPGNFYALGRAISKELKLVHIDPVVTTHPESGKKYKSKTPPVPDKIRALLPSLADLPQEADTKNRNMVELKEEVKRLQKLVSLQEKGTGSITANAQMIIDKLRDQVKEAKEVNGKNERLVKMCFKELNNLEQISKGFFLKIKGLCEQAINYQPQPINELTPLNLPIVNVGPVKIEKNLPKRDIVNLGSSIILNPSIEPEDIAKLPKCEQMILQFLRQFPGKTFKKEQIGVFTLYKYSGGAFNNAIYKLKAMGLIGSGNGSYNINNNCLPLNLPAIVMPTVESWYEKLGKCPREILRLLVEANGEGINKDDIATQTGYGGGGGSFNNAIYELNGLGLTVKENGMIKLNPDINDLR